MHRSLIAFLRRNTTIKLRVYLLGALILSLFYSASIFSFINHLNDITSEKRQTISFVVSELLTKTADQALWRGNTEQLNSVVTALINSTQIRKISVIDSKGDIFFALEEDSQDRASLKVKHLSVDVFRTRLAAEFNDFDTDTESVKDKIIKLGSIDVEIDEEALVDLVWSAMIEKSYALFLALLLSIPVSYLLAISLLKPLQKMMIDLQRFEVGDYSQYDEEYEFKDEFAVLSGALTRAGKSIERKTREIERANEELQQHSDELEKQIEIAIEARRTADEANARKDIFVANISHELKTPLTGVVSGLDLVEQNLYHALSRIDDIDHNSSFGMEEKKELLEDIFRIVKCVDIAKYSSKQIDDMVNEILASIQDIYDEVSISERPVHLNESLISLINPHKFYAEQKGLKFEFINEGCDDVWVLTDRTRVAQVINAIISNSTKFTEKGLVKVVVRILATSEIVSLFVEISDTGIGISNSEKDAIFSLFHIGESPSKKTAPGIGTGLTIAKRITKKLGGSLSLKSSIFGQGSCFTFDCTFKRFREGNVTSLDVSSSCISRKPIFNNLSLLYVEDSMVNQQIFQQYCLRTGVDLIIAKDGLEGFEKYTRGRGRFNALVIDCYMPVMNGFELVKKIREYERSNNIKSSLIFALTADDSDMNRKRCLECGFDEFIAKPYHEKIFVNELLERVAVNK